MTIVLKGWSQQDNRMTKTFKFKSFSQALGFMVEVSLYCEKNDHHPAWKNIYDTVHVELQTHDAGGVTAKDMELAAHMNKVFDRD